MSKVTSPRNLEISRSRDCKRPSLQNWKSLATRHKSLKQWIKL